MSSALWNGKYNGCVLKFQIGIDFLGRIILFTGPHLAYDGHIWLDTALEHPMLRWELFLGDGHYTGLPDVLWPYRKDHPLTLSETLYNAIHSFYCARVEHVIRCVKFHGMFSTTYTGSWEVLTWALKVIVHTTNVEAHQFLKYLPVGPWSH